LYSALRSKEDPQKRKKKIGQRKSSLAKRVISHDKNLTKISQAG